MKLTDGLFVIPGYDGAATGGNVAVRVTSEGVIIVDSKLPTLYSDIVDKVKSVSPQPIKYVLSTHQHGDHTGSNAQFLKTAEILMHRNARANMITQKLAGPGRIVFTDQQSVFLGGVEVQMRYLGRGHTNGDSVIYFPDLAHGAHRRSRGLGQAVAGHHPHARTWTTRPAAAAARNGWPRSTRCSRSTSRPPFPDTGRS